MSAILYKEITNKYIKNGLALKSMDDYTQFYAFNLYDNTNDSVFRFTGEPTKLTDKSYENGNIVVKVVSDNLDKYKRFLNIKILKKIAVDLVDNGDLFQEKYTSTQLYKSIRPLMKNTGLMCVHTTDVHVTTNDEDHVVSDVVSLKKLCGVDGLFIPTYEFQYVKVSENGIIPLLKLVSLTMKIVPTKDDKLSYYTSSEEEKEEPKKTLNITKVQPYTIEDSDEDDFVDYF